MEVEHFINTVFASKTYVVYENNKAVVIDIGDFEPVRKFIVNSNLQIEALFITHTHYDHIYGVRDFIKYFPDISIYTSVFGKIAFNKPNWNFSRYHGDNIALESDLIKSLDSGDKVKVFDNKEIIVMATPGHDKSCLSYLLENKLFTGDSFIPGVKVITSFTNSNKDEAVAWYDKLSDMATKFEIYSGHNPQI